MHEGAREARHYASMETVLRWRKAARRGEGGGTFPPTDHSLYASAMIVPPFAIAAGAMPPLPPAASRICLRSNRVASYSSRVGSCGTLAGATTGPRVCAFAGSGRIFGCHSAVGT
mmetsp:Transcript_47382/g.157941  ORF Transcript_47382/g.157941 Transcript_47382/m.157941 type:complete len:115 (+) Transcript_47382:211-555(+)